MNQKSLIQLILVLLIIVISTSVYLSYFDKKNENLKTNTKVIKIENKIVKNSDYIMKYGLLLGCHQGLNKKHLNFIHQKVLNLIK